MLRQRTKKLRGDTIIEVLLAMTVIGLVLGSSYAIANRSLRIGREAQERTEALKIVETQLERLRTLSGVQDNGLVDITNDFCIDQSNALVDFGVRNDFDSFTETVTDETVYPDIGGDRPCNQGTEERYGVTLTRSDTPETYTFTIRTRWESIGGGPLQELTSQYRIYPAGNTAFQALLPPPAPTPDPSTLCQDNAGGATNVGSPLPCEYPPAVTPGFDPIIFYSIGADRINIVTYISGLNLNDDIVSETGHIYVQGNNSSVTLETNDVQKEIDTNEGEGGIAIDNRIYGLTKNTEYTVRPYITIGSDRFYGDATTFTTENVVAIGDVGPGGGKVFYDKGNTNGGWRYMEAFVTNTSRFMGCSDPGTKLGDSIGNGLPNTTTMDPLCGSASPIRYASNFTRSDEDDWFIPSYHELNMLITNRSAAGLTMSGSYWTSSNSSSPWTRAFYYRNTDGGGSYGVLNDTNDTHKIVVVRRF